MTIQDLEQGTSAEQGMGDSSIIDEGNHEFTKQGNGKGLHIADKLKNGVGTSLLVLGGVGAGMLLMYLFDPQQGRRRRSLARDKAVSAGNKTKKVIGRKSRDLRNRAQGVLIEAKKTLMPGNKNQAGDIIPQENNESMNQEQNAQA